MTATLVATPDRQPSVCTCRFVNVRTKLGFQWVFRRDRACPSHGTSRRPV